MSINTESWSYSHFNDKRQVWRAALLVSGRCSPRPFWSAADQNGRGLPRPCGLLGTRPFRRAAVMTVSLIDDWDYPCWRLMFWLDARFVAAVSEFRYSHSPLYTMQGQNFKKFPGIPGVNLAHFNFRNFRKFPKALVTSKRPQREEEETKI